MNIGKLLISIVLIVVSYGNYAISIAEDSLSVKKSAIPNSDKIKTHYTYSMENPVVLRPIKEPKIWISMNRDQVLYARENIPAISINYHNAKGLTISWELIDGYGKRLDTEERKGSNNTSKIDIVLPPVNGYYEIIARISDKKIPVTEVRRSVGIVLPSHKTTNDDLFGIWVQGQDYYGELGAKWTRFAINIDNYTKDRKDYLHAIRKRMRALRGSGIKLILYPKRIPKALSSSRDVLKETSEVWTAWKNILKGIIIDFREDASAWSVVNEPAVTHWEGDNELIVRYWTEMKKLLNLLDPDKPLIGASLNPNKPQLLKQYKDLLSKGFGKIVDGIEFHTYMRNILHQGKIIHLAMPEDIDWEERMAVISQWTTVGGKRKDVYITEMGMPAQYNQELFQAQFLSRAYLWAKKMHIKTLIWHCFSYPQGGKERARNYAIFRNSIKDTIPQPRPAGVAYAVITRQLLDAKFLREMDLLPKGVSGFEFERGKEKIWVLWVPHGNEKRINLDVEHEMVTQTNLFGKTEILLSSNSSISLNVGPSPVYLSLKAKAD